MSRPIKRKKKPEPALYPWTRVEYNPDTGKIETSLTFLLDPRLPVRVGNQILAPHEVDGLPRGVDGQVVLDTACDYID